MFHVKQFANHQIETTNVSRETLQNIENLWEVHKPQLYRYAARLLWWNKKINLLSRSITRSQVEEHVQHSLWITASAAWGNGAEHVVDAGSGGGLPGIPLAITHPQKHVQLVDVVEKKTLATRQIIRDLNLTNVTASQQRIELLPTDETRKLYVSKHAFKLDDFFSQSFPDVNSTAIFLKGDDFRDELLRCPFPLHIKAIDLGALAISDFYQGKYVLTIKRIE